MLRLLTSIAFFALQAAIVQCACDCSSITGKTLACTSMSAEDADFSRTSKTFAPCMADLKELVVVKLEQGTFTSLSFFQNAVFKDTIVDVQLFDNNELVSLSGIDALSNVNRLWLRENANLESATKLEAMSWSNVRTLWIYGHTKLIDASWIKSITSAPNLERISLQDNGFTDIPALDKFRSTLAYLSIRNNGLGLADKDMSIVCNAPGPWETMKNLDLQGNRITKEGISCLNQVDFPKLESLNVLDNDICGLTTCPLPYITATKCRYDAEIPCTKAPSMSPTLSPTSSPTTSPTSSPTSSPTTSPTSSPTTKAPTTKEPTKQPTPAPTANCHSYKSKKKCVRNGACGWRQQARKCIIKPTPAPTAPTAPTTPSPTNDRAFDCKTLKKKKQCRNRKQQCAWKKSKCLNK